MRGPARFVDVVWGAVAAAGVGLFCVALVDDAAYGRFLYSMLLR